MKKAILATKVGMTQIFNEEDGVLIPVTVLQAGPCVVTQVKTVENDGYSAVQVGYVDKKEKIVTKDNSGKRRAGQVRFLGRQRGDGGLCARGAGRRGRAVADLRAGQDRRRRRRDGGTVYGQPEHRHAGCRRAGAAGRYTDCVGELLIKVMYAKAKRVKIR